MPESRSYKIIKTPSENAVQEPGLPVAASNNRLWFLSDGHELRRRFLLIEALARPLVSRVGHRFVKTRK